jgi:hypothetical protein
MATGSVIEVAAAEGIVSIGEAARRAGISYMQANRWVERLGLVAGRIGANRYIREVDIPRLSEAGKPAKAEWEARQSR